MGSRTPNPNRVKVNRSYTVEEVATLFGVHPNTVRQWIKTGLKVCDERRPTLILGFQLREFLHDRKRTRRRKCGVDELYCMRCRTPKRPAGDMVDYLPGTDSSGRLTALCPSCYGTMNQFASTRRLAKIRAHLDVSSRVQRDT